MKLFVLSVFAAIAALLLATGRAEPNTEGVAVAPAATPDGQSAGIMPSGPLFPLAPENADYDVVAVPEPVWASVLAACAVSLLRRGRSY